MSGYGGGRSIEDRAVLVAQSCVALAAKLVDGFSVTDLLDRLVADCVNLLDTDAAGVVLLNPERTFDVVASPDEVASLLEQFQVDGSSGPGIDAFRGEQSIAVDDLAETEHASPAFRSALERAGYCAMYAVPMCLHTETIGALSLFNLDRPLSESGRGLAGALADVATTAILQQRRLTQATQLAEQLQGALESRIAIERAIGVLAEYGGVAMGVAFDALRRYSRSNRLNMHGVAEQIVSRELEPGTVVSRRRG